MHAPRRKSTTKSNITVGTIQTTPPNYDHRMSTTFCHMPREQQDPRTSFAAERTFLAWIRTGLGLMGVGFAVARFGLFLREMRSTELHMVLHHPGTLALLLALIGVGMGIYLLFIS